MFQIFCNENTIKKEKDIKIISKKKEEEKIEENLVPEEREKIDIDLSYIREQKRLKKNNFTIVKKTIVEMLKSIVFLKEIKEKSNFLIQEMKNDPNSKDLIDYLKKISFCAEKMIQEFLSKRNKIFVNYPSIWLSFDCAMETKKISKLPSFIKFFVTKFSRFDLKNITSSPDLINQVRAGVTDSLENISDEMNEVTRDFLDYVEKSSIENKYVNTINRLSRIVALINSSIKVLKKVKKMEISNF